MKSFLIKTVRKTKAFLALFFNSLFSCEGAFNNSAGVTANVLGEATPTFFKCVYSVGGTQTERGTIHSGDEVFFDVALYNKSRRTIKNLTVKATSSQPFITTPQSSYRSYGSLRPHSYKTGSYGDSTASASLLRFSNKQTFRAFFVPSKHHMPRRRSKLPSID